MKKLIIIGIILVTISLFFGLDLNHYLTLDFIKENRNQLASLQVQSPWLVIIGFFVIYIIATALSLPGATLLTLLAGALFGLWQGTLIVSFASSIGATLAFLTSRYLLRDSVQQRFGDKLKSINDGVAKDGALYLFTLRLVPVFPFFLINLLMGLTPIRTATYYWVSQLGMLAGTLVYINAGTQLAQITSLSGIASPAVLLSFALLGIFPLITKRFISFIQKRRVYARWTKPKSFDQNLVVIGAGAAGLVTSYIAAAVKAKVVLVEAHKMGGDCLNYGCVPSKAIIKSAKIAHQMAQADRYGLEPCSLDNASPKFSFKKVMARVHELIAAIEPHDSVERYTKLGVEVLQGYAKIVDPWTVEVALNAGGTRRITTRSIVIAAGGKPQVPKLAGLEDVGYVTSDTLWDKFAKLDEAPTRLIVLGGGPIGCELAQSFARLGSKVTLIVRGKRIMSGEDEEVSEFALQLLKADGINVLTEHNTVRCEKIGASKFVVVEKTGFEKNGLEQSIEFDEFLCATGREARLSGYGLEELGIDTSRTVNVNEYLETLYPNIYAAGDVAGPYQFTHVAAHQAWYAAVNALFGSFKRFKADYSVIPWSTFIDPEVARVGLNESDAKQKGIAYEVTRFDLKELDRAITDSVAHGFIKVLTVPSKDKILGVTIVSEHAGDLLAEYVLAMKHGLGLNKILGTIHIYPTLAEANKYVAGEWKRAHSPTKLLKFVQKYHTWKRG
jgi:pyruvate/2-oxoglutarate dehydrogenase complex dihydrolipoamide dehydrogenase (E3) component/uncharacterized membrane protein YdjX (TVP38/TMEM64 family)